MNKFLPPRQKSTKGISNSKSRKNICSISFALTIAYPIYCIIFAASKELSLKI